MSSVTQYIQRKCRLPLAKIHRVPHITLYGHFDADRKTLQAVQKTYEAASRKYDYLQYLVNGFRWCEGEKGKVIYYNVIPSKELVSYREEIADKMKGIAGSSKPWDYQKNFLFHSTLAYKLTNSEFNRTWSFILGKKSLMQKLLNFFVKPQEHSIGNFYQPMFGLRTTLLNNEAKIACEYDFLQNRLLTRQEALSKSEWQRTLQLFRVKKGMENCNISKKDIYLISDLHLDHANIIKYCSRPFAVYDVDEMNNVLVKNWNNIVRENSVVFLGDLSFGKGSRSSDVWLEKLSGSITFIRGNHERVKNSKDYEILECEGERFLLVHDPSRLPIKWNGWVIHGHKHNNEIKRYPFINGKNKTINVCAELVNYKPVGMSYLLSLGLNSIKRMDTVDSIPERKLPWKVQ